MSRYDDWLEARKPLITGSCAGPILGVGPISALELYGQKTGQIQDKDSDAKEVGRALEPAILSLLNSRILAKRKWKLHAVQPWTLVRHPTLEWMGATPDAYYTDHDGERGIVEAKSQQWESRVEIHAAPTPSQMAQCQHNMEACKVNRCILVVLVGGFALKHVVLARDPEFVGNLLIHEEAFRKRVEHRNPPAPDDSTSAAKALAAVYPDTESDIVTLPEEASAWWEELESYRRMSRQLDQNRRAVGNALRGAMGQHRFGLLEDGRLIERLTYRQKMQARSVTRLKLTTLSSAQSSLQNG